MVDKKLGGVVAAASASLVARTAVRTVATRVKGEGLKKAMWEAGCTDFMATLLAEALRGGGNCPSVPSTSEYSAHATQSDLDL